MHLELAQLSVTQVSKTKQKGIVWPRAQLQSATSWGFFGKMNVSLLLF